jgi:hypothetical protein
MISSMLRGDDSRRTLLEPDFFKRITSSGAQSSPSRLLKLNNNSSQAFLDASDRSIRRSINFSTNKPKTVVDDSASSAYHESEIRRLQEVNGDLSQQLAELSQRLDELMLKAKQKQI